MDISMKDARPFYETKEFKDKIDVDSKQCLYHQNVFNWPAKPAKHSSNSGQEKNSLKRPLDCPVQSMKGIKTPIEIAKFQNECMDGNFPVILNVFTLSKDSIPRFKQKRMSEKFPVTLPCSPHPKPIQFTEDENFSSCGEISTTFTSIKSTRLFLNESTTLPKMSDIYNPPIRHNQEKLTNEALPVSPDTTNQFIDRNTSAVEDQNLNDDVGYARKNQNFPVWKNDNEIHSDGMELVTKGNFVVPEKISSYCAIRDDASKSCNVYNSQSFLSPREMKVLELKKRLLEQEAALKKLRTKR